MHDSSNLRRGKGVNDTIFYYFNRYYFMLSIATFDINCLEEKVSQCNANYLNHLSKIWTPYEPAKASVCEQLKGYTFALIQHYIT